MAGTSQQCQLIRERLLGQTFCRVKDDGLNATACFATAGFHISAQRCHMWEDCKFSAQHSVAFGTQDNLRYISAYTCQRDIQKSAVLIAGIALGIIAVGIIVYLVIFAPMSRRYTRLRQALLLAQATLSSTQGLR